MSEHLAPFVPHLALELGHDEPPVWRSVDGSMLSADISGFTALSEKLAGKGKAGAEEITELINVCFTTLINAAYAYGGEVLKFGGDALLVLFRGDRHERRAADAGLLMQEVLHASTTARRASLTMTVGVSDGPFDVFLVGSGYRELLVTGDRASEVIRLEGEAAKGDTLVSASIASKLPDEMTVRAEAGGFVITGRTGDPPPGPRRREIEGHDLEPYVPRPVLEQWSAFEGLGGEHRLVTVGFAMITGVSGHTRTHGPGGTAWALGVVVDGIVAACEKYGVTALHTDIAPDGVKFVLCAGAPVNPGDTADALLQAALEIATIDSSLVIRQGVQTGRVFAGFLGSDVRRTYTLMGDPVNTAARMLGKAGDREIVAVESVVEDTRAVFTTEAIEPFLVKGKAEPITAHHVRGVTDRVRRDSAGTRLIGRSEELALLTRVIGELDGVVEVVGPAGVGKSRLLDAAWDMAEGLRIHQASCTPYGAASPYSVFRPLLRAGVGIPVDVDGDEAGNELRRIVTEAASHLLPMLPLLAVPFGARVGTTPEADAISPQFRRTRIHEVVLDFLDAIAARPLLLVVEDAHWIDDASGDLLNHLIGAAAGRPWTAIITRRPVGAWRIDEHADGVVTLELEALHDADIRSLAIEVSTRPLRDTELELIIERSAGNPLFALELARALERSADDDLPDSIEQLIVQRFDQLPPEVRRVIRVAAVLGNGFDECDARAMIEAEHEEIADDHFAAAERQHLIHRLDSGRWGFVHALYRDAAYEALPFARRRRLHETAATLIEERASDPSVVAPLLSLHYSVAGRHDAAWRHSLVAGEEAEQQHATADAAIAYERALAAGRHQRPSDPARRSLVAAKLGRLYFVLGRFDDAERSLRAARRLTRDPTVDVDLMRQLGEVKERRGHAKQALRWYQRALARIPQHTTVSSLRSARAHVLLAEAGLRHRLGDNERCVALAKQALRDADFSKDRPARALALERIHLGSVFLQQHDDARGVQALEAHQDLADQNGVVRTLINLGAQAYFRGDWTRAQECHLEAAELAYGSGDAVLGGTASLNAAEILCDQGQWTVAAGMLDDVRRNFSAVGYATGVAVSMLYSSVTSMRMGELDTARTRLADARDRLIAFGAADLIDDLETRAIELELSNGRAPVDVIERLIERLGRAHSLAPRLAWSHGLALHRVSDAARAISVLQDALELAADADFERLLALVLLASLDDDPGHFKGRRREIDRLHQQLGVTALPPVIEPWYSALVGDDQVMRG